MSGVGNDFIIFDARASSLQLTSAQIRKLCNRKNIGCDQLILVKNSEKADCLMEIFNPDGSKSGACGNATRSVASLIMDEKNLHQIKIETAAGVLPCWRAGEGENLRSALGLPNAAENQDISVAMAIPVFENNFYFDDLNFACVNVGNPHAVSFVEHIPADEDFLKIGPAVENHKFFPQKTNVEFACIAPNKHTIEVRVWERGAGETLACGSGACAVAALAIKNNLVNSKKITVRFKGGDLLIEWAGGQEPVIMTGGYEKIFAGEIDEKFL